jgi:putative spermidine/putrescine transport system permease protein
MREVTREAGAAPSSGARGGPIHLLRRSTPWLGLVPFFLYVTVFLLIPTIGLAVNAFQDNNGKLTAHYLQRSLDAQYFADFKTSLRISAISALTSGILGLLIAYAAVKEGSPRWIRAVITTFSGAAANFAGVPLAFVVVATIGPGGMLTTFLSNHNVTAYDSSFVTTTSGLIFTYTYFQLPLMILVISPALDGLRKEWREASVSLGSSTFQFWRWVGLPILWPSLLGAIVLLFGSSFSAYATAAALTNGTIGLVPIDIANILNGNFATEDPQLGSALALGMIVVIGVTMTVYALLQRRSARWLK